MQYPDRRVFRLFLLLLDLLALTAAFQLAVETRIALNAFYGFQMTHSSIAWNVPPLGLILPLWMLASAWLALYRPRRTAVLGTLIQVAESVMAVMTITIVVTFFFRDLGTNVSRTFVLYFACWSLLFMSGARLLLHLVLGAAQRRGRALERIVVGPRPHVLLLDCLMPRMNGEQFLDALEREGIRIPVLLFTAAQRLPAELVERAAGVINKPCGIERLLASIETAAASRPTFAGLAKCGWRSAGIAAATAATGS